MASIDPEKAQDGHGVGLTVHTSPLSAKRSYDTIEPIGASSPLSEKTHGGSLDIARSSDEIETPGACHHVRTGENPFDADIEAMISSSHGHARRHGSKAGGRCGSKSSLTKITSSDCQVWPGQDHWRQKARAEKMKRSCTCLARLSRRNRTIVKIIIALLIIGIAVGVGVGISKPLGAGIWHPGNSPA